MAHTVSPRLLAERLRAVRVVYASGEFARRSPLWGCLPEGQMPLSVAYCARLWGTATQPAALTLRMLAQAGDIALVREGKRGRPGIPAIYRVVPEVEEHK